MAEKVKRRVAAARLAVAFAAAGTIAGAAAWAQAGPPPPVAKESILISSQKVKLDSSNIKNNSLLFQDFKSGQVLSFKQFIKFENSYKNSNAAISKKYLSKSEADQTYIKLSDADARFIKLSDADSRYIKLSDNVVRGDGSVFTATGESTAGKPAIRVLDVPNMFTVDASGPIVTITNTSGQAMSHTACGQETAGSLQPGGQLSCPAGGGIAQTLQLISAGAGGGPHVSTLNFSAIDAGGGLTVNTVQVLIGL